MIVKLVEWDYECGDGCCYNWGVSMHLDGVKVEEDFTSEEAALKWLIQKHFHLHVVFEEYDCG